MFAPAIAEEEEVELSLTAHAKETGDTLSQTGVVELPPCKRPPEAMPHLFYAASVPIIQPARPKQAGPGLACKMGGRSHLAVTLQEEDDPVEELEDEATGALQGMPLGQQSLHKILRYFS